MNNDNNPFAYEGANKLSPKQLLQYYIEDFNYSRFIHSKRNIFLVGERGTGKTMALLYNTLPVQILKAQEDRKKLDLSIISIYVPCNTPLFHRKEHELLDPLHASLSSEHFLVISLMSKAVESISKIDNVMTPEDEKAVRAELAYVLSLDIPDTIPIFKALQLALDKRNTIVQEALNSKGDSETLLNGLFSFGSGLRPLLNCFSNLPLLKNSHFSLMIDDSQMFNEYQKLILNSWISFRDNTLFSFKVTTTRADSPTYKTSSGGTILESHDFTKIDLEQPYQNKMSKFGKLARDIIEKRLKAIDVHIKPDDFFPIHKDFDKGLKEAKKEARRQAEEKYPDGTAKQKNDYIYKYERAIYFRNRPAKANLPYYSGFELLVHLSTGVIRNLLDPCYHMYDLMYSEWHAKGSKNLFELNSIPPRIQAEVIKERSTKRWEWAKDDLDKTIDTCSREDAQHVYQLLDNLAVLFRERLLCDISEPRAIVFTISDYRDDLKDKLNRVLTVARKAQLLYMFTSSSKDDGKREPYFMPNRILWPIRGLDPVGQNARVSIKAIHLWNAADQNKKIPFDKGEKLNDQTDSRQKKFPHTK